MTQAVPASGITPLARRLVPLRASGRHVEGGKTVREEFCRDTPMGDEG